MLIFYILFLSVLSIGDNALLQPFILFLFLKLIAYETLDPEAMLSVPTPDHYLPLLYIAGMRKKDEAVTFSLEGFDGGSISMLTVELGL